MAKFDIKRWLQNIEKKMVWWDIAKNLILQFSKIIIHFEIISKYKDIFITQNYNNVFRTKK